MLGLSWTDLELTLRLRLITDEAKHLVTTVYNLQRSSGLQVLDELTVVSRGLHGGHYICQDGISCPI